ncbi:MAG TPA: hypothetical protein VGJ28_21515, partial [Micromonosporaceae bacterium]
GINLREYVTSRAGLTGNRLSATVLLRSLADTLRAMHTPDVPGATPVLHMDIKPSNIMALTNGDVRLIDFTGARYWRHEEITQIAYTPESGGPEALDGQVSPSYDVHGFGAVAFFLLAGVPPRGQHAVPMDRHPLFDGRPALRDHLLAALADKPSDRPASSELRAWVDRLVMLVRSTGVPDLGLDWSEPQVNAAAAMDPNRIVGRARPVLAGTETEAYSRIELLERELVALRANGPTEPEAGRALLPPPVPASVSPGPVAGNPVPAAERSMLVGRAAVVPRPPSEPGDGEYGGGPAPPVAAKVARSPGARLRRLKRGGTWSIVGVSFVLVCWIIWAASNRARGLYVAPAAFVGTLIVACGVFIVLRLVGQLVLEGWMHRSRRGATGAHFGVAVFLVAVGITYLEQTSWIAHLFGKL